LHQDGKTPFRVRSDGVDDLAPTSAFGRKGDMIGRETDFSGGFSLALKPPRRRRSPWLDYRPAAVMVREGWTVARIGTALMPAHLKFVLSLIVCAVAGAMYYFETRGGGAAVAWVAVGLGAFMIVAIWLFPETRREPDRGA